MTIELSIVYIIANRTNCSSKNVLRRLFENSFHTITVAKEEIINFTDR